MVGSGRDRSPFNAELHAADSEAGEGWGNLDAIYLYSSPSPLPHAHSTHCPLLPQLLLGDNAAAGAVLDKDSGYRAGMMWTEGRVSLWPAQLTQDDKGNVRKVMQSSSWAREDGKH